jgi:hypothetical protein
MTRNTIAFMSLTEKNDFLQILGRCEASARRALGPPRPPDR